jgi:uncharacterized protein
MGDHMAGKYLPRLIDKTIDFYLETFGAILLEGPKWCGKTTTASIHSKSILKMQDSDQSKNFMKIADANPSILLEGDNPRLIDEWQMAPVLWDAVRSEVDKREIPGQYILTGSVTPPKDSVMHTGTGRIARLTMRTMSLSESGDSSGLVSLKSLFQENSQISAQSKLTIKNLTYLVCRGGWPQSVGKSERSSLLIANQYVKSIYNNDLLSQAGITKDPKRMQAVLRSYARNIQTLASNKVILEDIKSKDIGISETTLYSYLNILERLFIIEETNSWAPRVRSKTAIRTSNKKGFTDPSIAAAILGLTPDMLLKDFETFGFLFESLCIRDLRIYAEQLDGEVFHYSDQYGLEADAVIRLNNGNYALIEVKLGNKSEEQGAKNLIKLESLLLNNGHPEAAFKMILTGGEYAYRRDDGVLVVPLGCLGI